MSVKVEETYRVSSMHKEQLLTTCPLTENIQCGIRVSTFLCLCVCFVLLCEFVCQQSVYK